MVTPQLAALPIDRFSSPAQFTFSCGMVVLIIATVVLAGYAYKRIKKRRAQKRARKLAALKHADNGAAQATECGDDGLLEDPVIITDESSPPPYSTPTPRPAEPSEDPLYSTVPDLDHPEAYVRDKPPPYSTAVLQVQNA